MKISCWTLFIMLSFCGAKIVFFTVKQTKFQLVFKGRLNRFYISCTYPIPIPSMSFLKMPEK